MIFTYLYIRYRERSHYDLIFKSSIVSLLYVYEYYIANYFSAELNLLNNYKKYSSTHMINFN